MISIEQNDLVPEAQNPDGVCIINDRCMIRSQEGHRIVLVSGMVLSQYSQRDRMAEAHAMVSLIEQGWADQNDVAHAFGCTTRTVRRHQSRFDEGGLTALGQRRGWPFGKSRMPPSRRKRIQELKAHGHSHHDIAHRMGVSTKAIRKVLRRLGWSGTTPSSEQMTLKLEVSACGDPPCADGTLGGDPKLSAFSTGEVLPQSSDRDPRDRWRDRMLACLGMLDDAPPLFCTRTAVPRAGVLLALPALVGSGVFDCVKKVYGGIGPAFFGLRTTVLTLLLMALWRIRRPEGLKEHTPADLGCVLGIDRAPEVETLRRKLSRLSAMGRATDLGRLLAQARVAQYGGALGFLYVDGHVRVYHGTRRLPKAHVARMRLSMPATTDYWINDATGDPVFVMTADANAGLVRMLPPVLREVRAFLGSRRATVVFDRGGYSPRLFQHIVASGLDLLTYRRGRFPPVPARLFSKHCAVVEGRTVSYVLADQDVLLLHGALRLRQVTRLAEDGHQTPILTSRRDLSAAHVACRMFDRWRQENFFKYLREEFALDALADYAVAPDDPARDVPNPAWARADAQYRQARAHLERLQAEYGIEVLANDEQQRRTMRGFKTAQGALRGKMHDALRRMNHAMACRASIPKRVPVQSLSPDPVVKLAPETKHLTNLLKTVAYQAESELLRMVTPHYRRADDEGRTLLHAAFASAADFAVSDSDLLVTLAPQSSPHRIRAIAALCDELNAATVRFPGSRLRLRFAIHPLK